MDEREQESEAEPEAESEAVRQAREVKKQAHASGSVAPLSRQIWRSDSHTGKIAYLLQCPVPHFPPLFSIGGTSTVLQCRQPYSHLPRAFAPTLHSSRLPPLPHHPTLIIEHLMPPAGRSRVNEVKLQGDSFLHSRSVGRLYLGVV